MLIHRKNLKKIKELPTTNIVGSWLRYTKRRHLPNIGAGCRPARDVLVGRDKLGERR